MSWTAERSVSLSQQMTAHAADRRCPDCGRKFALTGYGLCRYVALGKCEPK